MVEVVEAAAAVVEVVVVEEEEVVVEEEEEEEVVAVAVVGTSVCLPLHSSWRASERLSEEVQGLRESLQTAEDKLVEEAQVYSSLNVLSQEKVKFTHVVLFQGM